MAADVEALLHDVLVFLQRLQPQHLPADCQDAYKTLVARLAQADGAYRPSYLDMNGARTLQRLRISEPFPTKPADDVDGRYLRSTGTSYKTRASRQSYSSSVDCLDCLDEDGVDVWPPRKGPSCVRPDLSPDWALSAAEAASRALHCGPVFRSGPSAGPYRWFRLRRRAWAALLPGRLLVFAGARASRPRLVLLLGPATSTTTTAAAATSATTATSCCAACCATYSARPRSEGPAFELCCPGRKTHKLWVSDQLEAKRWLEALRRAAGGVSAPAGATTGNAYVDVVVSVPEATESRPPACTPTTTVAANSNSSSTGPLAPDAADPTGSQASVASLPAALVIPVSPSGNPMTSPRASPMAQLLAEQTSIASAHQIDEQQQQYESMLSGNEEIYHDIASPNHEAPSYANLQPLKLDNKEILINGTDNSDPHAKPLLYDDIAVMPKSPEYCNLLPDPTNFVQGEEEISPGEHLYDDIGPTKVGPTESRASVYELIQDPMINQGIRCS